MRSPTAILRLSAPAACPRAGLDTVVPSNWETGIPSSNGGGTLHTGAGQQSRRGRHDPGGAGVMMPRWVAAMALAALLASMPAAVAQVARNGDEYGGKDHQPTEAEVAGRERRAGIAPSPSQTGSDNRTVDQLGQRLLRDEKLDPPAATASAGPPADPPTLAPRR